jgi:hypothetical protein
MRGNGGMTFKPHRCWADHRWTFGSWVASERGECYNRAIHCKTCGKQNIGVQSLKGTEKPNDTDDIPPPKVYSLFDE